ncbi:iron-siderophore ABC transporter substrate-binding protein [Pigmentiphaga litoralis]|uniref:iron-siderophore ABC transporter substrate-binding protein n=1 Tax=Pigmentiphaga litoralis TaxID=516702 RepID=UPI001E46FDCA|nr:iron-siderophore ABC transporter substrate-binding protein [Pigmentiphaga litoralis]
MTPAWVAAQAVGAAAAAGPVLVPSPGTVRAPGAGQTGPVIARQSADLPARARRIVSLDDLSTEILMSLGVAPLAAANLDSYRRYVDLHADLLKDSQPLGSPQQPDLEALVRLQPDLIVGVSYLHLPLFDRLQRIAPTLLFQVSLAPGSLDGVDIGAAMLATLGNMTGRQDIARRMLASSARAVSQTRAAIASKGLAGTPVVPFYPLSREGTFIVSNDQSMIAALMNRLDVANPWRLASGHALHRRIGVREIAGRNDLTALFVGGQEGAPLFKTPLWQALPVARAGRYAFLPSPYWTFGGPTSVERLAGQVADAVRAMSAAKPSMQVPG